MLSYIYIYREREIVEEGDVGECYGNTQTDQTDLGEPRRGAEEKGLIFV